MEKDVHGVFSIKQEIKDKRLFIKTLGDSGRIIQEKIIDVEDELIRDALKKMGWLPPQKLSKLYTLVENLCDIAFAERHSGQLDRIRDGLGFLLGEVSGN